MVVADVSFADIFWSVLWFFFLFIWLMILFQILSDVFRDHSVSGVEKTLWVLFLVFLPFLAVFIYLIVRGKGMGERSAARQQQAQQEFGLRSQRRRPCSGDADRADARAKELLDAGATDQSSSIGWAKTRLSARFDVAPGRTVTSAKQAGMVAYRRLAYVRESPSAGFVLLATTAPHVRIDCIQWRQVGERPV
jgi:hypothetical protein